VNIKRGFNKDMRVDSTPHKNDPRLGGRVNPKEGWGFASSGIREYFCLQTSNKGREGIVLTLCVEKYL
jgi:hypothetical protein